VSVQRVLRWGSGVDAAVTKKVFVGSGKEEREEDKKKEQVWRKEG
jgi:hypothetical protein